MLNLSVGQLQVMISALYALKAKESTKEDFSEDFFGYIDELQTKIEKELKLTVKAQSDLIRTCR